MDDVLDVWITGRYAGQLTQDTQGRVGFAYDDVYRADLGAPALSVSMTKAASRHSPDVVEPWIDNLLPDNDTLRERWAARFGERRASAFNLLRHMGRDCAGAVQILPTGETASTDGDLTPLSEADIETALAALRADESAWTFGEHGGRYSLGGAQGKFAATRTSDGWALPTGRTPSTHVFKVGIPHRDDSVLAEYVTMRAARDLGLRVTGTELLRFGQEYALVSQRFDRVSRPGGVVDRIHQEDVCQALGVSRHRKYQSDGGPGLEDIGRLLRTVVDPRDRGAARELIAGSVAFNWAAAGTDAHAKNFALAHLGSRVVVAPLYDLTSAALLEQPKELANTAKFAMKIGGEYRLGKVESRHLERAATMIGVEPDWMIQTADRYARDLPDAVSTILAGLPADLEMDQTPRAAFTAGITARTHDALRAIATPQTGASIAPPSPVGTDDSLHLSQERERKSPPPTSNPHSGGYSR